MITVDFNDMSGGKIFNDVFGTIRLVDGKEYALNQKMIITIRGTELGIAELVAKRQFYFNELRDPIAFLETGESAFILSRKLGRKHGNLKTDSKFYHLIFQYKERNIQNMAPLLDEWWKSISFINPAA